MRLSSVLLGLALAGSAFAGCLPSNGKTLLAHPSHKLDSLRAEAAAYVPPQSVNVVSCGSASTQATATITTYAQAWVLAVSGQSNSHCGGTAPIAWQQVIPYSASAPFNNDVVYWVDDTGCGGNCWDLGGMVTVEDGVDTSRGPRRNSGNQNRAAILANKKHSEKERREDEEKEETTKRKRQEYRKDSVSFCPAVLGLTTTCASLSVLVRVLLYFFFGNLLYFRPDRSTAWMVEEGVRAVASKLCNIPK
jgi:hypothetical protein